MIFMARNDRKPRVWEFAINDMEVGSADGTGRDLDAHLPRTGRRRLPLDQAERPADGFKHHGFR